MDRVGRGQGPGARAGGREGGRPSPTHRYTRLCSTAGRSTPSRRSRSARCRQNSSSCGVGAPPGRGGGEGPESVSLPAMPGRARPAPPRAGPPRGRAGGCSMLQERGGGGGPPQGRGGGGRAHLRVGAQGGHREPGWIRRRGRRRRLGRRGGLHRLHLGRGHGPPESAEGGNLATPTERAPKPASTSTPASTPALPQIGIQLQVFPRIMVPKVFPRDRFPRKFPNSARASGPIPRFCGTGPTLSRQAGFPLAPETGHAERPASPQNPRSGRRSSM